MPLTLRADSGFFSWDLLAILDRLSVTWSITVHQNASVQAAIATIPEDAWHDITYPDSGAAQVAETIYVTGGGKTKRAGHRVRLVVRRTRLTDRAQRQLWPDWRHHAFVTNLELDAVEADRFHRAHATVELAIRDLKEGAGLEHCPSGRFFANAAWLGCAVLAHNLIRWTAALGGIRTAYRLTVASTVRLRVLALPWTPRQPCGSARPPTTQTLAMGAVLHHRARRTCVPCRSSPDQPPAAGAAADISPVR